jgi:hypothetical protein
LRSKSLHTICRTTVCRPGTNPTPYGDVPWDCDSGRRGEQYIRQTIGSLLDGLSKDKQDSVYLNVLIGQTDSLEHPISDDRWLETLPNKVLKYKEADIGRIRQWEEADLYSNTTIFNYAYLLNDCYTTGAQYIAMIEDDTLAIEG